MIENGSGSRAGARRGLQNRWAVWKHAVGGFDSHALPPFRLAAISVSGSTFILIGRKFAIRTRSLQAPVTSSTDHFKHRSLRTLIKAACSSIRYRSRRLRLLPDFDDDLFREFMFLSTIVAIASSQVGNVFGLRDLWPES